MNLFVIGWNCRTDERSRARAALRAMHETFPLLDPGTLDAWNGARGFAAWMQPSPDAVGPRRYVHGAGRDLVLYDGAPVDPSGGLAAHRADELAAHWSELDGRLEGQFAAVRMDDEAETLEVLNDPFGLHPTFVHQRGRTWWIANSVRLLARAAGLTSIDLEGMARCIGMYWPGGDRTLVQGASIMPAAQRWRWVADEPPRRTTYWPVSELAVRRKRSFGAPQARALADAMGGMLATLADAFGPLECPITAGRDSRMLTGLMIARGLPGTFFSNGEPDAPDVVYGTAIAERFGLPHRRSQRTKEDLAAAWDEVSLRVVRKLDGMVTLMHAGNALARPERLERIAVHLYGGGGELGRGKRFTDGFLLRRPGMQDAVARAATAFDHGPGLLRPDARQLVRDHIERTCRSLAALGFAPVDIPDAFDVHEYGRRWGGAQARQVGDHKDVVLPFFTRAYMAAAFATPPIERRLQRVPYVLLEHLSPELRAMPGQSPWPPPSFAAHLLGRAAGAPRDLLERAWRRLRRHGRVPAGKRRDRLFLLDGQLPRWRERFLDRGHAGLWSIVDRQRFEHLTSGRASEAELRSQLVNLYQVVTAFAYVEDFEEWVGRPG